MCLNFLKLYRNKTFHIRELLTKNYIYFDTNKYLLRSLKAWKETLPLNYSDPWKSCWNKCLIWSFLIPQLEPCGEKLLQPIRDQDISRNGYFDHLFLCNCFACSDCSWINSPGKRKTIIKVLCCITDGLLSCLSVNHGAVTQNYNCIVIDIQNHNNDKIKNYRSCRGCTDKSPILN